MRRLGRRSLAGPPAAHAVVLKTISTPPPPQPSSLRIGTRATLEPHGGVAEWFAPSARRARQAAGPPAAHAVVFENHFKAAAASATKPTHRDPRYTRAARRSGRVV